MFELFDKIRKHQRLTVGLAVEQMMTAWLRKNGLPYTPPPVGEEPEERGE
jgi:hypothetical protein